MVYMNNVKILWLEFSFGFFFFFWKNIKKLQKAHFELFEKAQKSTPKACFFE